MIEDRIPSSQKDLSNTKNIKDGRSKTVSVARAILMVLHAHLGIINPELSKRCEACAYDMIDSYHTKDKSIDESANRLIAYINIIKDNNNDLTEECLLLLKGLTYIKQKDTANTLKVVEDIMSYNEELDIKDSHFGLSLTTQHQVIKDKVPTFAKSQFLVPVPRVPKAESAELTPNQVISMRKTSRKSEVLSFLSYTPLSIKKIASSVVGCSEKTIQRELNSLLLDGSIKRVGEKRWSKYCLK